MSKSNPIPNFGTAALSNTLTYGSYGFALFGIVGLIKTVMNRNQPEVKFESDSYFPNIKYDTFVQESLNRLLPFKNHAPQAYQNLEENIDKLIGLQILVNQGKIQASYPYKASRHYNNIENAMREFEYKIRNVVTPHFATDKSTFLQIADDYRKNITLDSNSFLMNHRTT